MGRFINGMFIGAGIALLVAPMRGEDLRARLSERFAELRGSLPESDQVASQVQQTKENVSDLAKRSAKKARQAGQGIAGSVKQGAETSGTATAPFPSAYPEYVNPETKTNY